jgi:hypothetical protein
MEVVGHNPTIAGSLSAIQCEQRDRHELPAEANHVLASRTGTVTAKIAEIAL